MSIRTLTIDIGGTGTKMLRVGEGGVPLGERARELTPKPSTPDALLVLVGEMIARQQPFDRVSVGFPGVVKRGVVATAPNLGTEHWAGFDLEAAIAGITGRPTRVVNDADLQGYGVISGEGVEMVLTFGTGLGSALYVDGRLLPNLELGHHPLRKDRTYEDLVGEPALERIGRKRWRKRVDLVFDTLARIFNFDVLHVGGGNARVLAEPLPGYVRRFDNVEGMRGGARLWRDWD